MRAVAALLMAPAVLIDAQRLPPKSLLAATKNYESQGFAGERCNTETPGQGCKTFYRCANQGAEFVLTQRAQREQELLAVQVQLKSDLVKEAEAGRAAIEKEIGEAKKEREDLLAKMSGDIKSEIDEFNVNRNKIKDELLAQLEA